MRTLQTVGDSVDGGREERQEAFGLRYLVSSQIWVRASESARMRRTPGKQSLAFTLTSFFLISLCLEKMGSNYCEKNAL